MMADFVNTVDIVGDKALLDSIIDKTVTEYRDDTCEKLGDNAFINASNLSILETPNIVTLGASNVFNGTKVKKLVFRKLETIPGYTFNSVSSVKTLDCHALTNIANKAFPYGTSLTSLILRKTDGVCTLSSSSNTWGTPYIYVPKALVDTYKSATNWSTYADQFRALEDYTVDGTITGELDETKI